MKINKIISKHKSWYELNKTLEKYSKSNQTKLAGDIFEMVVKLYFQVAPVYRSKLKKVYILKEVPSSLKIKLNLPNEDNGIDIIAETFDNEFYAVQCKYRSDPDDTLVLSELTNFSNLAFVHCKHISHGIVCATTNKPPKKVKLLKNTGFEIIDTWLSLDDNNKELWNLITSKAIGKIVKPKLFKPKPHQVKAIAKSIDHFKTNDRGKMIMPCGTGKSLTAFWIAEKLNVKSVIIAVPSLALLQQTLKVWTREYLLRGYDPDWICVCSDDTVKEEQDDFVSFTYDLGIHVTTDTAEIKNFLKKKNNKIKILFTTYQSGRITAQAAKGFKFDLGIMDEAHKTVGLSDKPMAHLIHEKNIKIKRRLFMTATERIIKGKKNQEEYISMDSLNNYGKVIYELSFKEAINSVPPIISDYKVMTFNVQVPKIEELYNSNKYLQIKKEIKDITARELATALALRKSIKEYNIKNAISFHRSIRRAKNFKKQQELISKVYPEYGSLNTFNVNGEMPAAERANQMRLFTEKKGLITNARCLTEGVDLPSIDCVCFTDPKRSKVDIVQAAGRALRLSKGKKIGYILIPVFIPEEKKFNEYAKEQGYEEVALTVAHLATTDKRIVDYLKVLASGKKPLGGSPIDGIVKINALEKIDAEEFNRAVQLKIWDKVAFGNFRPYKEAIKWLKPYKLKNSIEYVKLYQTYKEFPADIPRTPQRFYENFSWGDYLSSGFVATQNRKYRSYADASKYFIGKKNINSATDFANFKKDKNFPDDIPRNPWSTYAKVWRGWGFFLTGKKTYRNSDKKLLFVDYDEFSKSIRERKINTLKKFEKFKNSIEYPFNFPKAPDQAYKNKGWINYPTLFGRPTFKELVKILEKEKSVINASQYKSFIKKIKKKLIYPYPDNPHMVYKDEFKKLGGWYYFLNIKSKLSILEEQYKLKKKIKEPIVRYDAYFLSYKDAKEYIKKFNIESGDKWRTFTKTTKFPKKLIPLSPSTYYKNKGWVSWPDFLSKKGFIAFHLRVYDSFENCMQYARSKKISSSRKWTDHTKTEQFKKLNFPTKPQRTYYKLWKGWADFLGKK